MTEAPVTVRLLGDDPNGLAAMVADLLRTRLERDPRRTSLLRGDLIGVRATDIGQSVTLSLRPQGVEIANGIAKGRVSLTVRADAATLLALTDVRVRFGLPRPFETHTRTMVRNMRGGSLRVKGLRGHPAAGLRLLRLLAAAS
jgi:hypothetical protein